MSGKHSIFGILFVIGAAVQYNDPDGILWGAWYAGAAAASFAANRWPKEAGMGAAFLCFGSVAWLLAIVNGGLDPVGIGELVGTIGMKTENVERWREAGGLGIIAIWMLIVAVEGLRQKPSR